MQYSILEASEIPGKMSFSFWQSHIWQKILVDSGQASEVFYFGEVSGARILVEIRSIGLGQYGAFSIGVTNSQLVSVNLDLFFQELCSILKNKGCLFYQIEPLDILDKEIYKIGISDGYTYKNFLIPYTRHLDIGVSSESILAQMHEKGRYNIRLALKRGVTVQSVIINDENIDIWMQLLHETTDRDGFAHNSRKYYKSFLNKITSDDSGELLFAYYEEKVIAAMIVVYTSSCAIYYYGASVSDRDLRKHMAPYLLQWTAILHAKDRNIPLYDFLGISEPNKENDSLKSVSEFKEKFGGYVSRLPEKIICSLSWKSRLFFILRSFLKS